jgi:hypothetical protein
MIHRKVGPLFTATGSLAMAISLGLLNWAHGNPAHFAAGFFLGLSVVLLIGGVVRRSRARPEQ